MANSSLPTDCLTSSELNDLMTSTISITSPVTGSSSSYLYSNSISGSSMWSTGTYTVGTSAVPQYHFQNSKGQEVFSIPSNEEPTLDIKGKVRMNGEDLAERLERIETLLNIPTRNVTIEQQFPKLKALYEEYMAELEKYKTWNRLTKGTEK